MDHRTDAGRAAHGEFRKKLTFHKTLATVTHSNVLLCGRIDSMTNARQVIEQDLRDFDARIASKDVQIKGTRIALAKLEAERDRDLAAAEALRSVLSRLEEPVQNVLEYEQVSKSPASAPPVMEHGISFRERVRRFYRQTDREFDVNEIRARLALNSGEGSGIYNVLSEGLRSGELIKTERGKYAYVRPSEITHTIISQELDGAA